MPLEFLLWAFGETQFVASARAFMMSNGLEARASSLVSGARGTPKYPHQ